VKELKLFKISMQKTSSIYTKHATLSSLHRTKKKEQENKEEQNGMGSNEFMKRVNEIRKPKKNI
jgi:hypothetical protein